MIDLVFCHQELIFKSYKYAWEKFVELILVKPVFRVKMLITNNYGLNKLYV